jgi:hypothetical protein
LKTLVSSQITGNIDNIDSKPVGLPPAGVGTFRSRFVGAGVDDGIRLCCCCCSAAAAASTYSMSANVTFSDDDEDEEAMPWERYNWVPLQKCGKQKTPNMVSALKHNRSQRLLYVCWTLRNNYS